jgi:uncharacterized protein YjbI with pentapeptide repeats
MQLKIAVLLEHYRDVLQLGFEGILTVLKIDSPPTVGHEMNSDELLKHYAAGQTDFRQVSLSGAKLSKARLPFIILTEANLRAADLSKTHLAGAELVRATLINAKLAGANLIGANLQGANLQGANLVKALLGGAMLAQTNLSQAILDGVSLSGTDLSGANLKGASLRNANLRDANLRSANLRNADLTKADLEGTDLTGAIMPNGEQVLSMQLGSDNLPYSTRPPIGLTISDNTRKSQFSTEPQRPIAPDRAIHFKPSQTITDSHIFEAEWGAVAQAGAALIQSAPSTAEEAKILVKTSIAKRRGHYEFHQKLLKLYNYRCAITNCNAEPVLEVAYLLPQLGSESPHTSTAVLLRADLHTLFDLHLLAIDLETLTVLLAPELEMTSYRALAGKPLAVPQDNEAKPSRKAIAYHLQQCEWYQQNG